MNQSKKMCIKQYNCTVKLCFACLCSLPVHSQSELEQNPLRQLDRDVLFWKTGNKKKILFVMIFQNGQRIEAWFCQKAYIQLCKPRQSYRLLIFNLYKIKRESIQYKQLKQQILVPICHNKFESDEIDFFGAIKQIYKTIISKLQFNIVYQLMFFFSLPQMFHAYRY